MTSDAVPRWARALTLPSVLFISALAGHAAAGGVTPAPPVLVFLFVITVAVLGPLVGALISPARIVALLIVGEGLLHIALELLGRSTVMTAMNNPAAMSSPTGCHLIRTLANVHWIAARAGALITFHDGDSISSPPEQRRQRRAGNPGT